MSFVQNEHAAASAPIGWAVSATAIDYPDAAAAMQRHALQVAERRAGELVWLLQHRPLYTAGTSARPEELLPNARLPVHPTGRGGRLTYHGPGQRIAYLMLDLRRLGGDVRLFVHTLEEWIIGALADLGVAAGTRPGRVGVWVARGGGRDAKIAAIGLRVSRGISLHGISLNVCPDLAHYAGIVPCGITGHGVTSLADLDVSASMEIVDNALRGHFERRFGPTQDAAAPLAGASHPAPHAAAGVAR